MRGALASATRARGSAALFLTLVKAPFACVPQISHQGCFCNVSTSHQLSIVQNPPRKVQRKVDVDGMLGGAPSHIRLLPAHEAALSCRGVEHRQDPPRQPPEHLEMFGCTGCQRVHGKGVGYPGVRPRSERRRACAGRGAPRERHLLKRVTSQASPLSMQYTPSDVTSIVDHTVHVSIARDTRTNTAVSKGLRWCALLTSGKYCCASGKYCCYPWTKRPQARSGLLEGVAI